MRRGEWLVRAVLVFCLLYGAIAVVDRTNEVFPFFAWDLFATVPNPHGTDYSIRITGQDGMAVTVPEYFEDSNRLSDDLEVQGYTALQQLGRSVERGLPAQAAAERERFDATYLSGAKVTYELVKRTFDVRRRVDCRTCFLDETVIATYSTGTGS